MKIKLMKYKKNRKNYIISWINKMVLLNNSRTQSNKIMNGLINSNKK